MSRHCPDGHWLPRRASIRCASGPPQIELLGHLVVAIKDLEPSTTWSLRSARTAELPTTRVVGREVRSVRAATALPRRYRERCDQVVLGRPRQPPSACPRTTDTSLGPRRELGTRRSLRGCWAQARKLQGRAVERPRSRRARRLQGRDRRGCHRRARLHDRGRRHDQGHRGRCRGQAGGRDRCHRARRHRRLDVVPRRRSQVRRSGRSHVAVVASGRLPGQRAPHLERSAPQAR